MGKLLKIILSVVAASLLGACSSKIVIINSGDDFDSAVKDWSNETDSQKTQDWNRFEAKYSSIYDSVIYQKQDPDWQGRMEKKRTAFFAEIPNLKSKMDEVFKNAKSITQEREDLFRSQFPDLKDNIPVYFLPSMISFNGKVVELPQYKRTGLLIGVDAVVKRNDNLNVLFSHEFFHAYHEDKLTPGSTGATMATPLWKEGFATHVSGVLNPGQPDDVLLMDEKLTKACQDPKFVKEIARQYIQLLGTDGEKTYSDWFMMSGKTQPVRRGYCLGLRVIREIAKSNELSEMATWSEAKFSPMILDQLNKIIEN